MTRTAIADCPHCRSTNVTTSNLGRKCTVMLGGVAGGIFSAATVWHGARVGAVVGAPTGPAGALLSAVAGAVLAALAGAATGCAAGGVVGDMIDHKVLNNYRCLACGHRFSRPSMADVLEPRSEDPRPGPHAGAAHQDHPSFPGYPGHGYGPHWPPEDSDEEHAYGFYGPYPYPDCAVS